jgi:hypothetical protein
LVFDRFSLGARAFFEERDLEAHSKKISSDCAMLPRKFIADFLNIYPCLQRKVTFTKFVIRYRRWAQKCMADYYPLISNAIAGLDERTSEARHAFYDRARAILVDKLRKADPPVSETIIEQERLALEDAISNVEADATRGEKTWPIPDTLQSQSVHTDDSIRKASMEASPTEPVAKLQRERRFAFWGFLILAALWIGDLFYKPPTFSNWHDWLRLGGVILFPTMTILSYFILRKELSAEEEERAYIISTPIVFVGSVLATVALYLIFGRLAAPPS